MTRPPMLGIRHVALVVADLAAALGALTEGRGDEAMQAYEEVLRKSHVIRRGPEVERVRRPDTIRHD